MHYKLTSSSWDQGEIDAIKQIIDKGIYSMSDKVFEFEEKLAE